MHQRDTSGLKKHAQAKREEAIQRTEEGIRQLIKNKQPVSFKTVAEVADVSRAWLYQQEDIRARIEHLRKQQSKKGSIPAEQRASKESSAAIIRTLKERIKKYQAENQELRQQLEVAYGRLIYAEDEAERCKRQLDMLRRKSKQLDPDDQPTSTAVKPELEKVLQELGVTLNSTLERLLQNTPQGIVDTAIESLREAASNGRVINPGGFLNRALQDAWKPNETHQVNTDMQIFNEWWKAAYNQGLVKAATQIDGVQHVLTADEEWVPFEEALAANRTR